MAWRIETCDYAVHDATTGEELGERRFEKVALEEATRKLKD